MTAAGALHFGRYAFPPNRLGYCGPEDSEELLQRLADAATDRGLLELERRFEGAFPYLQLIARANGITDPFDERVVSAYWLGNRLLQRVDPRPFHDSLRERFRGRMDARSFEWLTSGLHAGAVPHHNFHVFEVYRRAGLLNGDRAGPVLAVMDSCRISWGRVVEAESGRLLVARRPLVLRDGRLALGSPEIVGVERERGGIGYSVSVTVGDWVSIHWSWACEELPAAALGWLRRMTADAIARANRTL